MAVRTFKTVPVAHIIFVPDRLTQRFGPQLPDIAKLPSPLVAPCAASPSGASRPHFLPVWSGLSDGVYAVFS